MSETLYNGITLPKKWPPANIEGQSVAPLPVPYLENPPEAIEINIGRQLFVDDFLIERTTLALVYHQPIKDVRNPVMRPETEAEKENLPCACPKSGGVWYDEGKYKMWYEAGWLNKLAYAESVDGIHWERPSLDVVSGTNLILPGVEMDSSAVFIDRDTQNKRERYKMFVRDPGGLKPGAAFVSADGIHWSDPIETSPLQDRSTIFYNPFRKKWVYSIRRILDKKRVRLYRECDDFLAGAKWSDQEQAFWLRTDRMDQPDPGIGMSPQLYNFDAVGYESIMLGLFQIHLGPENNVCRDTGIPKITELQVCYSRDGFHFSRPIRTPFIAASRTRESWDRGYVQSVGGVCVVHKDELWFYYIGFQGDEGRTLPNLRLGGMHDHSATGIARLRRDGFASLRGDGFVQTRKLLAASDRRYLFVNAAMANGELRASLETEDGETVPGYGIGDCVPMTVDAACTRILWCGAEQLPDSCGRPFRLRFQVKNGDFYSFWISSDALGASHGMIAAGEVG